MLSQFVGSLLLLSTPSKVLKNILFRMLPMMMLMMLSAAASER